MELEALSTAPSRRSEGDRRHQQKPPGAAEGSSASPRRRALRDRVRPARRARLRRGARRDVGRRRFDQVQHRSRTADRASPRSADMNHRRSPSAPPRTRPLTTFEHIIVERAERAVDQHPGRSLDQDAREHQRTAARPGSAPDPIDAISSSISVKPLDAEPVERAACRRSRRSSPASTDTPAPRATCRAADTACPAADQNICSPRGRMISPLPHGQESGERPEELRLARSRRTQYENALRRL